MAVRIENSVENGMPDTVMTCDGKTVFIELKAEFAVRPKQEDWARRWVKAGGTSWFLIAADDLLYLIPGSVLLWRAHVVPDKKWIIRNCREAVERILR
jgi:hypothetical protein